MANVDSVLTAEYVSLPAVFVGDTVVADGIPTDSVVGDHTVLADYNVEPTGIASEEEVTDSSFFIYTPLDQEMTITGILPGSMVETPVASYDQAVNADSVELLAAVSDVFAWLDYGIEVPVYSGSSGEIVSQPTVLIDNQNVEPVGIEITELIGSINIYEVLAFEQTVEPEEIGSEEVVSDVQAKNPETMTLPSIESEESLGEPTVINDPSVVSVTANSVLAVIGLTQQYEKPSSSLELSASVSGIEVGGFIYMTPRSAVSSEEFFEDA